MALLKHQTDISAQRPLPVANVEDGYQRSSVTGETVQLYYYNSGVLTIDAGQSAGVVVVGSLTNFPILNNVGSVIATEKDSSLTFTSTALTSEQVFDWGRFEATDNASGTVKAVAVTQGFTNGQYCVDYRTGTIYGVKADTSVTLTATAYKIKKSTSVISDTGAAITTVNNQTRANLVEAVATATANTNETTLQAANATNFLDLISLVVTNNSLQDTLVTIRDATGGGTARIFYIPAYGGIVIAFPTALPQAAKNNNWTYQCGTSVTSVYIHAVFAKN